MPKRKSSNKNKLNLDVNEKREAEDLSAPHALIIYESISNQGRHELERPSTSIIFSGIAAGLLISFSLIAKSILTVPWGGVPASEIFVHLAYCVGFVIVILGRLQLFTENTITPILPMLVDFHKSSFLKTLRLWVLVLCSNLIGTFIAAAGLYYGGVLVLEHVEAMIHISNELTHLTFYEALVRSIPAGLLMASIVWLLPSAQYSGIWVIIFFTFLMSAGHFPHIIVGSVEAWVVIFNQSATLYSMIYNFFVPVLLGNVIGGTGLFAMLAYAQVHAEKE